MGKKLRLASNEDVRLAIRQRGNEIAAKMSDKEIYTSAAFTSYATKLANFILRKNKLYSLKIAYNTAPSASIAYTDGKQIFWNTGNKIASFPKLLERRFKVNMGILFHECAHCLFLDFQTKEKALDTLKSGKLYGKFCTNGDPTLETAKKELTDALPSYSAAIQSVYANICNIIDDGHDEAAMKRTFPGFIKECIQTAGEVQMETASSLSQAIQDKWDGYSIYCSLLLMYAKFGYYKAGDSTPEVEAYLDGMKPIEAVVDEALLIDSLKQRWNCINQIVLYLWPVLRDTLQKDPAQSPDEVAKKLSDAAQSAMDAMNVAPAPKNGSGKGVDPKTIAVGSMAPGSGADIGQIAQQIAQEKATQDVQDALDKAQLELIQQSNVPLIHKSVPLHIKRHNPADEAAYKRIFDEIAPYERNLVKEMRALFREMNEQTVQHHRRFGPIVEASEAYRPDYRFFAKKKLPADLPNMAICLLIDLSGSMRGEKVECAKKTSILIERFASELNIPIMIAGHNAQWNEGVTLRIFSDYISAVTAQDRYSLAGIQARGCNRDGFPIQICGDLLAQRPEEIRLMIVISDGKPNHKDYSGVEAKRDITQIVNSLRRKGLLIYGAAIDADRAIIQEIYGQGFLSIQNLQSLPKTLVRLIRQKMV